MTEEFKMEDLLAQTPAATPGEVVSGMVVSQGENNLLVDIGLKQEAVLPLKEFPGGAPKVGEMVNVLVLKFKGPDGRPLVSFRQARERKNWDKIAASFEKKEPIKGKITARIKGGVTVDIGLDAFMPASQIDLKPVYQPEGWVGQEVEVAIVEMNKAKGNVLVSRRQLLEKDREIKKAETLKTLKEGIVVKGQVVGLTNFGAFVDIGGLEGLLHVSDMAWGRVDNPKDLVKVGDEIEVKVLKIDPANNRISLGRKQLLDHPLEELKKQHSIGSIVEGKVTGLAAFGAFVEIAPGVEGLIHVSEMSWTDRVKNPKDLLKSGQVVKAKLIGIDRENEKVSLSLKRVGDNPWDQAAAIYPNGTQIEVTVSHFAPFGIFVKTPLGLEALIKSHDISWTEKAQDFKTKYKVGEKINAVVLDVNPREEKMALGIKQLEKDPMKTYRVGDSVTGTVTKVAEFGVFVKLDHGMEGLIRNSELANTRSMLGESEGRGSRNDDIKSKFEVGQSVTAAILKVQRKERKIELSIRRYEREQERELLRKYSGQTQNPTLGEATGWHDDK